MKLCAACWNKVLIFNLGFDAKGPDGDHWLYVPDPAVCFYRVGFYDVIFGADRMSLYVEIGLDRHAVPIDESAWLERVLADLEHVGITTGQHLVAWHSAVLDPAYVHVTRHGKADFAERSAWLAERGVHSIGRYGGWTYCSIEDNIVEARSLAERLGGAIEREDA